MILMIVVMLQFGVQAQGQSLVWGDPVPVGSSGEGLLRPRIAINAASEAVVIWGSTSPIELRAAVGGSGGFAASTIINPAGVEPWSTTWAGADLASSGDDVFVLFSTGSLGVGAIYCVGSSDGGMTWGDTVRTAPQPGLEARFPTVAMVPGQGPVVLYMEFDPGWHNARYVASRSLDGGMTFQPPVPVSAPYAPDEVCDCCTGHITAQGTNMAALFRNNDADLRTIWGVVSNDNGGSFTTGAEIDPTGWMIGACPSSGPDAYIAGDSLRYVWMSGAVDGTKAYIGSAHWGTLATGPIRRVHLGPSVSTQQNFPRIAGAGDTLGVVWQQSVGGQHEVLFSWSTSGPSGLSAPDTINMALAGAQKNPDVSYANGEFHFIWEDHASSIVQYRTATITDDTGIAPTPDGALPLAWPSPANDLLHLAIPEGVTRLLVADAMGRIVLDIAPTIPISTATLPNGSYTLLAVDGTGRAMRSKFLVLH